MMSKSPQGHFNPIEEEPHVTTWYDKIKHIKKHNNTKSNIFQQYQH